MLGYILVYYIIKYNVLLFIIVNALLCKAITLV